MLRAKESFVPDLKNIPIVVLSNNDGCVIARSTEAKKMGIGMGVPWFKVKILFSLKKTVKSSHQTLLFMVICQLE